METAAHSKCASVSNALLIGSLCVILLAIPLFPVKGILWFAAVLLAVTGLLIRLLGVMQMSLAVWTTMILLISAAIVGCLSASEGGRGELSFLWAAAALPALIVWILATYTCWLFVDRALDANTIGGKWATFTICSLGPPAIIGTIITAIAVLGHLIAIPFSDRSEEALGGVFLWALFCAPCWRLTRAFRNLVRSARVANRTQRDAARKMLASG